MYDSDVVHHPIYITELRGDVVLANAIFLKRGPATSVVRLSPAEGIHLYRRLRATNPDVADVWADGESDTPPGHGLPDVDQLGIEGSTSLREHLITERDRRLIEAKKANVLRKWGRLSCEVCDFDFESVYGAIGHAICEVHHRTSLASFRGSRRTRMEDLAVVCSNCHRMIHHADHLLAVEELRERVRARRVGV